jgi:hypothetical protein
MWTMSEAIIKDAEEIADMMLQTGDEIRPIPLGKNLEAIAVTTSPKLVIVNHAFERGGKTFYIGLRPIA